MKLVARRGRSAYGLTGNGDGRPAQRHDAAIGLAVEDLLVHPAQRRAGIDAQLVDESFAHLPVGLEGVGLPAAAVLGEHQLPGQAFVERMGVQCRGELARAALCVDLRGARRRCGPVRRKAARPPRRCGRRSPTGCRATAKGSPRHRSSARSNRATASRGSAAALAWDAKSRKRCRSTDNASVVSA